MDLLLTRAFLAGVAVEPKVPLGDEPVPNTAEQLPVPPSVLPDL